MRPAPPARRPARHPQPRRVGAVLAGLTALTAVLAGTLAAGTARAATAVDGEVLLKLRSSQGLAPLLQRHPMTLAGRFGARPIFRVKTIGGTAAGPLIDALRAEPEVLLAEPNTLQAAPEAIKNNVWAIGSAQAYARQWAASALRLPQAQQLASGAGVRVALLDTGVDRSHPALAGRLDPGFDFVDFDTDPSEVGSVADPAYGHGTHVAGLVAMVAPGARLMPLRVLDPRGVGNAWVLGEALLHAVDPDGNPATDDGAQVINLSLGSTDRSQLLKVLAQLVSCTPPDPADPVADLSDPGYAGDKARCQRAGGAVVVAGAGNDGSPSLRTYPAAESAYGLLSVAASQADGRLAPFSNAGRWISLAAPGQAVTSTLPVAAGGWGTWSGTSMATPLVAGSAALLRSLAPALPAVDVARCLESTSSALKETRLRQVDPLAALRHQVATGRCR